jgi:hypothetical protein
MFVNPTYLHIYDNEYDDEEANENHYGEPWVIDMCGLRTPNDTSPNVEK